MFYDHNVFCSVAQVWTALTYRDSYHLYCKEIEYGEVGDTCQFEIAEFKLFNCKDWNNPNYTAGVNIIARKYI